MFFPRLSILTKEKSISLLFFANDLKESGIYNTRTIHHQLFCFFLNSLGLIPYFPLNKVEK